MKTIYALGVFDGVHLGHQALLKACVELAEKNHCQAGAVTFGSHPDGLISGSTPKLLCTTEDRKQFIEHYNIKHILLLPFDQQLRQQPWQDFLTMLLEKGAAGFVCGDDFRFGYKGEGNAKLLTAFCNKRNLPITVVPEQTLNGVRISSTHIRRCIEQGQMEEAVRFLGHPFVVTGVVVPGRQLGRTIGIPTANLQLPEGLAAPKFGVYACKVCVDGTDYMAVTNVGTRPTVGGHHVTVEPWILDFDGDLYGKILSLRFYKFLRPEQKFGSLEELKAEIQKNAAETWEYFLNFSNAL